MRDALCFIREILWVTRALLPFTRGIPGFTRDLLRFTRDNKIPSPLAGDFFLFIHQNSLQTVLMFYALCLLVLHQNNRPVTSQLHVHLAVLLMLHGI